jgi:hypothetical protein
MSPTSSYLDVVDYDDHFTFTIVSGSLEIDYRLKKVLANLKNQPKRNRYPNH